MEIGTASAAPGELSRGHYAVTDLPTGAPERLPVVIANGSRDGPQLWVTAGVHGDEATGLAAAQDVMDRLEPGDLSGSVVCLPLLNPSGVRRNARKSYYQDEDPNRGFPDPEADRHRPPSTNELIAERIYELFSDSADALLDLHTANVDSMPFLIRDRVLYGERRDREAARQLADDLERVAGAAGLPVVTEYEAEEYTGQILQRSTAGAALNGASIPALTFELGSPDVVQPRGRRLGVAGVVRVMLELDMLAAPPTDLAAPLAAPVEFPVRRELGPRVETPGICRHEVTAGDAVEAGETVARVRTPAGEPVETVHSDHDGYVLGRRPGVAVYENDPVASMAVRDDGDLVVPRDPDGEPDDSE